jgi:PAS domain S-box-containing protein
MTSHGSDEREALVRGILDSALDAVVGMSSDGRVLEFSRAAEEMFGFAREEVIGRPLVEIIIPPDLRHRHREGLERFLATGRASVLGTRVELRALRKGGEEFPVELTITPLDLIGPPRFVGFIRDLTELKRSEAEKKSLEAKVLQAQKLESLGVLAGGIAHDFNNLLVGILGNADLALGDLPRSSPAVESIRDVGEAARHAAELCNQLLAYSGKGRFVIEAMSLNRVVQGMGQLLDASISKKASLRYDLDESLPSIEGDVTQIRQVIMNLITNASEAIGDESGVISIYTSTMTCEEADQRETFLGEQIAAGCYVTLEIADTGCGIQPDVLDRLFDPFFTTKFTGRGLGLAAVLGIMRGHGGSISVHSEPGRGTTFRLLFPSLERAQTPSAAPAPPAEGYRGEGTVLIADDDPTVRKVGRRILQKAGFDVLTASDGREALELFRARTHEILCVVLDLTMPHLDGVETFEQMRRLHAETPVVLCSGYNEQESIRRFAGKGLAGFVKKPYSARALVRAVLQAQRR